MHVINKNVQIGYKVQTIGIRGPQNISHPITPPPAAWTAHTRQVETMDSGCWCWCWYWCQILTSATPTPSEVHQTRQCSSNFSSLGESLHWVGSDSRAWFTGVESHVIIHSDVRKTVLWKKNPIFLTSWLTKHARIGALISPQRWTASVSLCQSRSTEEWFCSCKLFSI